MCENHVAQVCMLKSSEGTKFPGEACPQTSLDCCALCTWSAHLLSATWPSHHKVPPMPMMTIVGIGGTLWWLGHVAERRWADHVHSAQQSREV